MLHNTYPVSPVSEFRNFIMPAGIGCIDAAQCQPAARLIPDAPAAGSSAFIGKPGMFII
jgi:hypothetical protein